MTAHVEWVDTWCPKCCTSHLEEAQCPGELLATGPERHGWRMLADTPRGPEIYGTLIAPAGEVWRARILTYPNVLWVIPRGHSMKFVGSTPAEAEQAAVRFIKDHCRLRGYTARKEVPAVESGEVDLEQDATTARSDAVRASQRQLHTVLVRYGMGRPTQESETNDLSEGGLFIRTDEPLPVGTELHLHLDADGFGIPMRGVVRWKREEPAEGRPRGMGIKLVQPHPRYLHYIRQRHGKTVQQTAEATTYEVEEWEEPVPPAEVPEEPESEG